MTEARGQDPAALSTIFVSYSRGDQKRARPVIDLLEQAGYKVWWDGLLDPGERFSDTTEAALGRARAVVVLWSKASTHSHWVHDEATQGRDRQTLVPISLDGSEAPLGFRQFQVIDFSKSRLRPNAPEVQALLRAVAALHDRPFEAAAPAPQGFQLSRRALIGGGAAVVLGGGALAAWQGGLFGGGAAATSIAVLPFANLSGDPEQAYFSDGLAAEIRSQLTRNELLQVAAQTSSNVFRERREDAQTIARKLRVAWFLDGTVRRAGELVKISVELVSGATGLTKWEESFERPLANIFATQDEIAAKVASALSLEMDPSQRGKTGKQLGGTASVAAFDAYLRGRDLYDFGANEASDRAALAKFDEAIGIDANYASAHAARSRALAVIANLHAGPAERVTLYRKSMVAARRAVELAPELAEAHSALGFAIMVGQLDMGAARAPYERSLALGGGDADVLSRYAIFRSRFGDAAAAREAIAQSSALDPLNARTFRSMGDIALAAGQYGAAISGYERALTLNPKLFGAHTAIGFVYYLQGKLDLAAKALAAESNEERKLTGLAILAKRQGNAAEAQRAFDRMVALYGEKSHYEYARVRAQWGEADRAIAELQAARRLNDAGLVQMKVDPLLQPLRKRPEFAELLKSVGFV